MRRANPNSDDFHTAYLSIGSNMGDKLKHCSNALKAIEKNGVGRVLSASPYYSTEPVDYIDQDWFINAVVKIETRFDPFLLLSALQAIQRDEGRKKERIRFGPRIVDLDIIFFDNIILNHALLQIPHPRMHKRRFVLQPICDIDPQVVHPVFGQTIRVLLEQIDSGRQRIRRYPCAS